MNLKITGINYSYKIETIGEDNSYCFSIYCQHKKSKRKSGITNLNFILSDIVSQVMDETEIEDSWIDANKKQINKLFAVAIKCFEKKYWIEQLERNLDEDRIYGEWEANFKF